MTTQTNAQQTGENGPSGPSVGKVKRTPPAMSTLVLMAGSSVLAMNVFLPMLPAIARELNTTPAMAQYVLTVFLATSALAQLIIGPASDRFGRRPVVLACSAIFLVATLVCMFATSIEMLIVGRIFQATSAANLALSRAIIRDLFDREKAASMIGYVTMAMAVIPMLGPVAGGFIGEMFGWRGPFAMLFIIGVLMIILIWFDVGETHTPVRNPVGEQIRDYGSLLKEPLIWGYLGCATLASGAYFAFLGGAPFVGEIVLGLSPAALGAFFGFVALGYMFGNFLSGRYSQSVGIEPMMLYGGLVAAAGVALSLGLMSLFEPHAIYLFGPMLLVGMGNGMTLPNANAGAVSVRPELAGSASGLAGFMQIGGGAALAILSGMLISAENQGMPLYIIMFASSIGGAVIAAIMYQRAKRTPVEVT
ncbi:MAG: multidrug effflux MFS transporter [Pseudomonadota bacterium]